MLGLYSGNISADTLTVGCRRNIKPEMAEVKGKRLLIAAEMQEGARLNDSTVKQLCSTDDVFAEKKYKDPFSFKPCHTLVLYTNHLPRVSASDDGIWRRLIVIPFSAKITGKSDIKNYSEYLYDNAGESILAWVIEGAKKVIELEYQIPVPESVQKAINEYRSQNDWFGHFLEDKCDIGEGYKESSSSLYQAYRNYCIDTNEYVRSTADFYYALRRSRRRFPDLRAWMTRCIKVIYKSPLRPIKNSLRKSSVNTIDTPCTSRIKALMGGKYERKTDRKQVSFRSQKGRWHRTEIRISKFRRNARPPRFNT